MTSNKRFPIQLTARHNSQRTVTVYATEDRPGQWSLTRRQVLRAQRAVQLRSGDYLRAVSHHLTFSDLGSAGAQVNIV